MERLNRINFIIFFIIHIILQLGLIVLFSGVIDKELHILEVIIFLCLIVLTISIWRLILKRSHDFGARGGRHIAGCMFIPFYIFYIMFKEGDVGINEYGQKDNSILFMKQSTKVKVNTESLLHQNCEEGNIKEVKRIIEEGEDINIQNSIGSTPLMKAIANNRLDITELLLKKGADVKITRDDGYNALLIASHFGNVKMVKLLLDYDADINFYNKGNISALDIAISKGYIDIIKLLEDNIN